MKVTLFQLFALVGMAVAASATVDDNTRHLRRALEKESPAAAPEVNKDADDVPPPEGMIAFVGELDDEDKDGDAIDEDDPSGRRDLESCRTRCYLAGCRQYHYYYRSRYSHLMDCCQTYSGALVTCL